MRNGNDFRRIFSHLCHFVALKQDGKLTAAVESIVLTVFAFDRDLEPSSVSEIVEAISVYFGVQLTSTDVLAALETLMDDSRVEAIGEKYAVSVSTLNDYQKRLEEANRLEESVRLEWLDEISDFDSAEGGEWEANVWDCLKSYMARAFYHHGARTIGLLDPNIPSNEADTASLEQYFLQAKDHHCGKVSDKTVRIAIKRFFSFNSSLRTRFVIQLLDGTFTYFALTTDNVVARYLNESVPPVKLFLDSNFIFGLFDLRDDPLNEVSKELINSIVVNTLPIEMYYTLSTLEEMEQTLQFYGDRLRKTQWTPRTSRIALLSDPHMNGIERRYHNLNVSSRLDVSSFLSTYEQMTVLLDAKNFILYDEELELDEVQQNDLMADYDRFLTQRRGFSKRTETIKHDVTLWQTVCANRNFSAHGLHIGAFLVTVDYNFASYERRNLKMRNRVAATVIPNEALQLLRPFVTTSEESDRRFVETFALPEFRAVHEDYSATRDKVLRMINSYPDVSDETAIEILTNHMVLEQFNDVDEESQEFQRLFESQVARDNRRLSTEVAELENIAVQRQDEMESFRQKSIVQEKQLSEKDLQIETMEAKGHQANSEIEQLRRDKDQKDALLRGLAQSLLFVLVISVPVYWLAGDWLTSHVNRVGMIGLTIAFALLIFFRVAFGHRWRWLATRPNTRDLDIGVAVVVAGILIWLADPEQVSLGIGIIAVSGFWTAVKSK